MSEKIAFIVDSCADLPRELAQREEVFLLPVLVNCQGKEYLDGIEITADAVYEQQKQGLLPTTSLPTGELLEKALLSAIQAGYRKAVIITMSSAISGTWNMCRLLCEECEKLECLVFDSGMASLAEGALLAELLDETDQGTLSWEELPGRLETLKENTVPYFGIDTLEFLQKNGRVGKAAALAGNILNIMPILSFDENGVIAPVEKVRGKKQRMKRLKERALEILRQHEKCRLYFVHGGCPELAEELREEIAAELSYEPKTLFSSLGCALAAHLGPNLIGVCVQVVE